MSAGGGVLPMDPGCLVFCILRVSLLICDKLRLCKTVYLKDNRRVCPQKSMRFRMLESPWRTLLPQDVQYGITAFLRCSPLLINSFCSAHKGSLRKWNRSGSSSPK